MPYFWGEEKKKAVRKYKAESWFVAPATQRPQLKVEASAEMIYGAVS